MSFLDFWRSTRLRLRSQSRETETEHHYDVLDRFASCLCLRQRVLFQSAGGWCQSKFVVIDHVQLQSLTTLTYVWYLVYPGCDEFRSIDARRPCRVVKIILWQSLQKEC